MKGGNTMTGYLAIKLFYCLQQGQGSYQLFLTKVKCLWRCFEIPFPLCVFDISLLQTDCIHRSCGYCMRFALDCCGLWIRVKSSFCPSVSLETCPSHVLEIDGQTARPDRGYTFLVIVVQDILCSCCGCVCGDRSAPPGQCSRTRVSPEFQLKMHWLSTGLCLRMDFPHATCFYFVFCIAQDINFLSTLGTVCSKGSIAWPSNAVSVILATG